ncbi:MAG: nucleotidyl transferase AbiEii/AbiGii toxin family protein [Candidatus Aenigmatarchaeota archaeon]
MISKSELRDIAKRKNYNLGQAEKDYLQDIILSILYSEYGQELVFKGGTALSKCYGIDRFSKDLDFNFSKNDIEKVLKNGLDRFYLDYELDKKMGGDSHKLILRLKGPLYMGRRQSLCRIDLDLSTREEVIKDTELIGISRLLSEVPSFKVVAMSLDEILAEKVRAIMTRNRARDLYDLNYLIKSEVNPDLSLINKKLEYYGKEFTYKNFKKAIGTKESIWKSEMKPLVPTVPEFHDTFERVIGKFKNLSR